MRKSIYYSITSIYLIISFLIVFNMETLFPQVFGRLLFFIIYCLCASSYFTQIKKWIAEENLNTDGTKKEHPSD